MTLLTEDFRRKIERNWFWTTVGSCISITITIMATYLALRHGFFQIVPLSQEHRALLYVIIYGILALNTIPTWVIRGLRKDSMEYNFAEMGHLAKVEIHSRLGEVIAQEKHDLEVYSPGAPIKHTRRTT